MDSIIASFSAVADRDLMLCHEHGVAWQADRSAPVPYDAAYFDKYVGYEGADIAVRINNARKSLVARHIEPGHALLDVGIGSGEFIKSRPNTFGHDVNPKAIAWLKDRKLWAESLRAFTAFSFWDVLEHVETPKDYFDQMDAGSLLFTSLPIFDDLTRIRESKHYRPDEHFWYFTESGFVGWMGKHGFSLLEVNDDETVAGREAIKSFAFVRAFRA